MLSVVSVVCCQVEVSATDWSFVQRYHTDCSASLYVIKQPRTRGGYSPARGLQNTNPQWVVASGGKIMDLWYISWLHRASTILNPLLLPTDAHNVKKRRQYTFTQCTIHTPYRSQYAAIALTTTRTSFKQILLTKRVIFSKHWLWLPENGVYVNRNMLERNLMFLWPCIMNRSYKIPTWCT